MKRKRLIEEETCEDGDAGDKDETDTMDTVPPSTNRELPDAVKPVIKLTKRKSSIDDFQDKILSFMEKDMSVPVVDDDEIDLAFSSLSKRVKRAIPVDLWDVLIDDMNSLVSRHIRNFKRKHADSVSGSTSRADTVSTPEISLANEFDEVHDYDMDEEFTETVPQPTTVRRSVKRDTAVRSTASVQPMKPIRFYSVHGGYERQLEFEDL